MPEYLWIWDIEDNTEEPLDLPNQPPVPRPVQRYGLKRLGMNGPFKAVKLPSPDVIEVIVID